MAKNSCTFIPKKGVSLLQNLKKEYGYATAREIFVRVITPKFIKDYKDSLSLDAEGIPTFESVVSLPVIQEYVGDKTIHSSLDSKYRIVPNTLSNYKEEIQKARNFNEQSPYNNKYIAVVKAVENGIKVEVLPRTDESIKEFTDQYSNFLLAERLEEMFAPIGIYAKPMTEEESAGGKIGIISFGDTKSIAEGFSAIIKIANNMKGLPAISEEFSHLLVRMFYTNPLVQRGLNHIKNTPEILKSILGEKYESYTRLYENDIDKLSEEALGQVLQRELIGALTTKKASIFERIKNWIVQQFRSFSPDAVDYAVHETNGAMSKLANSILFGGARITSKDLAQSARNYELYSIENTLDSRRAVLEKMILTEEKRLRIGSRDEDLNLEAIKKESGEDGDSALGIFRYLYHALEKLKALNSELANINTMDPKSVFKFLRAVRMYSNSYDAVLKDMQDLIIEEQDNENSDTEDFIGDIAYDIPGIEDSMTVSEVINQISTLSDRLQRRWVKVSHSYLADFLSDYYDTNAIVNGEHISIETLLAKCATDISFTERWLDALSDSSDPLMQTLDQVVKAANDAIREEHITASRKIIALRQEMEEAGITSTEWMYERDGEGNLTGNYISELDYPAYYKARKAYMDYLDETYGEANMGRGAGEKARKMQEWLRENADSIFGNIPKKSKYASKAYAALSETQKQFLAKALKLKAAYDLMYPEDRVRTTKAIQIRQTSAQRTLQALKSPTKVMEAVKNAFRDTFIKTSSDETEFGISEGLRDFNGAEFFALPVLYTNRLENPNDLSTDFFSTLMQYSYATIRYKHMDKIVDPMEVARTWIKENRQVTKTRGNKIVQEVMRIGGEIVRQDVLESDATNLVQMLDDYYSSQLYGRMMKEGSEVAGVNVNKATNKLLGLSAMASLSFNWLAQIANVFNGVAMQNVEAAAKQFFKAGSLLKADVYYAKHLGGLFKNLGARRSDDTLSLLGAFLNIKQDYRNTIRKTQNKNLIERALGSSISFIGQEAGDHWLYYRVALAMMIEQQVIVPGKGKMALLDAIGIRDAAEGHGMKEMYLPQGTTDEQGNLFSVAKFGRKVAKVNHGLFGIYSSEDANAAHRTAVGRLALQFRKWMKPLINKRFQAKQWNASLGTEEEGYYRTALRFLSDIAKSKFNVTAIWNSLSEVEKQNLKRALVDSLQLFLVWLVGTFVEWPEDEDAPKVYKYVELIAKRMKMELGALHPTGIIGEGRKILKSPFAAISVLNSIYDIGAAVLAVEDYGEELQSGPYKGMTRIQKSLYKAPVWGLVHLRQINKMLGEQDELINYYARPY